MPLAWYKSKYDRTRSVKDIFGTKNKGEGLHNLVLNKQRISSKVGIYILNMCDTKSDIRSNCSGRLKSGDPVFEGTWYLHQGSVAQPVSDP